MPDRFTAPSRVEQNLLQFEAFQTSLCGIANFTFHIQPNLRTYFRDGQRNGQKEIGSQGRRTGKEHFRIAEGRKRVPQSKLDSLDKVNKEMARIDKEIKAEKAKAGK